MQAVLVAKLQHQASFLVAHLQQIKVALNPGAEQDQRQSMQKMKAKATKQVEAISYTLGSVF